MLELTGTIFGYCRFVVFIFVIDNLKSVYSLLLPWMNDRDNEWTRGRGRGRETEREGNFNLALNHECISFFYPSGLTSTVWIPIHLNANRGELAAKKRKQKSGSRKTIESSYATKHKLMVYYDSIFNNKTNHKRAIYARIMFILRMDENQVQLSIAFKCEKIAIFFEKSLDWNGDVCGN